LLINPTLASANPPLENRRVQTIHLGEDLVGRFGPLERLGIGVVLGDVAVDGGLQVDDRVKAAAPETAAGERGEEGLDRVQPRARGGGEVEHPARVPAELPLQHLGMLVAAVVVEDRARSTAFRKRMNSWCRWRCMQRLITVPSSTSSAANRVVVPLRL
jgi:hypothetical protein